MMLCSSIVCAQQDVGPHLPGPHLPSHQLPDTDAQSLVEHNASPVGEQASEQVTDTSNLILTQGAGVQAENSQLLEKPLSKPGQPLGLPRRSTETKPLEAAPRDETQPALGASWARIAGALGLTLALALGGLALLRKVSIGRNALGSARAPSGLVEVLARYPLAPRQNLIVLKLDRRVLLLAHSVGGRGEASSVRTLTEIVEPEEVASILLKTRDDEGDTIAARFREAMDKQAATHDTFDLAANGSGQARRPAHVAVRTGASRLAELA